MCAGSDYFFFEDFLVEPLGKSFEKVLLILAALFLGIMFFFAARSVREIAFTILFLDLFLLAILIALSRSTRIFLLNSAFLFDDLSALLAVLVTGISLSDNRKTRMTQIARASEIQKNTEKSDYLIFWFSDSQIIRVV